MSDLNLSEQTEKLVKAVKDSITVKDGSKDSLLVGSVYKENLPAELTPKVLKAKNEYDRAFAAATTLVAGERAIAMMEKDKDLEQVSVQADMSGDTFKANFARHKSGTVMAGEKKGEKWEKHCTPTITIKSKAANKSSQLGRVVSHLTDMGAKKLKK